jgi:hypothetical protein
MWRSSAVVILWRAAQKDGAETGSSVGSFKPSVALDEVRATQAGEVLVRRYDVPQDTLLSWTAYRQLNAGVSPPLGASQSVALDDSTEASPARAVLR